MTNPRSILRLSAAAGLVAGGLATAAPTPAQACGAEPYIGMVCITAATFCPRGYAELVGQTVAILDNTALYSLVGNLYGGDGRDTFGFPDLRARTVVGRNTQQLSDGRSFIGTGMVRGNEQVTLQEDQLAGHNHNAVFVPGAGGVTVDVQVATDNADSPTPLSGQYLATGYNPASFSPINQWKANPSGTVSLGGVSASGSLTGTVSVASTVGNEPVNVLDPAQALKYCMALTGLYPPRE